MASSGQSDHYPIKPGLDGKYGLATILDLTDGGVPLSGLEENITNLTSYLELFNLRVETVRDIRTPKGLRSSLGTVTSSSPSTLRKSITKEDSLSFVVLIAKGNEDTTSMPNEEWIKDVEIEQFLNEDNCVTLRGKPKLFLYLKYFTGMLSTARLIDFQPSRLNTTVVHVVDKPNSSTNLNIWSHNIYDFGIQSLRTMAKGSRVLQNLPEHFKEYGTVCDLVSFFKIFLGKMSELQRCSKSEELPTICITMRNLLIKKLYFLQPRGQKHEEQDTECYLSDSIEKVSFARCGSPTNGKNGSSQLMSYRNTPKYCPYPLSPNNSSKARNSSNFANSDKSTGYYEPSQQRGFLQTGKLHYKAKTPPHYPYDENSRETKPPNNLFLLPRARPSDTSVETDHSMLPDLDLSIFTPSLT